MTQNALVQFDGESALEQAFHADEARARGEWLGPLHGLPFSVKDCLDVKEFSRLCGSSMASVIRRVVPRFGVDASSFADDARKTDAKNK